MAVCIWQEFIILRRDKQQRLIKWYMYCNHYFSNNDEKYVNCHFLSVNHKIEYIEISNKKKAGSMLATGFFFLVLSFNQT